MDINIPPQTTRCTSFEEFRSFLASPANREVDIARFEVGLLPHTSVFAKLSTWFENRARALAKRRAVTAEKAFTFSGYCAVCDREAAFFVDYQHSWAQTSDGRRLPNWRERLVCPHCHMINRMRAVVEFVLSASKPDDTIYLTEFLSPLFQVVASRRKRTVGSEYLRDGTLPGATNVAGVRHEDATKLSFSDGAFNVIGTFDVLEHVPNYRQALAEFFRCLHPGGTLIITVPFLLQSAATVTRAIIDASGTITHLLPPEIHGDPLDPGGVLCFHHFGWDFVGALTAIGFEDAGLSLFWNPRFGYLGGYQLIITARSPGRNRDGAT
jgi:SAM-dependent methyltransferase